MDAGMEVGMRRPSLTVYHLVSDARFVFVLREWLLERDFICNGVVISETGMGSIHDPESDGDIIIWSAAASACSVICDLVTRLSGEQPLLVALDGATPPLAAQKRRIIRASGSFHDVDSLGARLTWLWNEVSVEAKANRAARLAREMPGASVSALSLQGADLQAHFWLLASTLMAAVVLAGSIYTVKTMGDPAAYSQIAQLPPPPAAFKDRD
jgi:hypothetical protein